MPGLITSTSRQRLGTFNWPRLGPDVEADVRVGGPPKGPADPFVRRAVWPQPWPIETSSAEPSLEAALVVAAI